MMKAVYIVDNVNVAKILIDPMRRAILDLLQTKPMTQAGLAKSLGLASASLNYHIKILKSKKLVVISKREAERHRIIQKFFSPSACLFVYDLDSLPTHIARYFYPVSLERTRGILSTMIISQPSRFTSLTPDMVDALSEKISRNLVMVAKKYESTAIEHGSIKIIYEIYTDAIKLALRDAG